MSKYFTLATDPLTADQTKELKSAFEHLLWWHWLPNYWLIKDEKGVEDPTSIRDKLNEVNKSARCLVLEVDKREWSAMAKPNAAGKDMTSWLRNHWEKN